MRVEKINDDKIIITLSFEELETRNISLNDIQNNDEQAKKLLTDLIEETKLDEEYNFEFEDSQLFIEASTDNNNQFFLTITRIKNFPELNIYTKNYLPSDSRIGIRLFEIPSFKTLLNLSKVLQESPSFLGNNTLYKYADKYLIIFSKSASNNKKFEKTFIILSEFCARYFNNESSCISIQEKGKLIIKNKAIQKICKYC